MSENNSKIENIEEMEILGNSSSEDSAGVVEIDQPKTKKARGPQTVHGKKRSKFNALKHGLLSKVVLLEGESPDEYRSLLKGVWDYLQPEGKLEAVLVENLAVAFWRKRRFHQAETAELSKTIAFMKIDFEAKELGDAWDWSRCAIESGGLLKHSNKSSVLREGREVLILIRENIIAFGLTEHPRLLKKLYGRDKDGGAPHGLCWFYEVYALMARQSEEGRSKANVVALKELMIAQIDAEIENLAKLEKIVKSDVQQLLVYRSAAAVIPGPDTLDRLLRYETHLTREIDKILNQLERLQRIREGQPVLPPLKVDIS